MRKVITILSFIFLFLGAAKADKCEQINCNQLKDYLNAKLIQGYLEKLAEKSKIDKENYDKIKSIFATNKIETPLNYNDLSQQLNNNNFKSVSAKIGEKLNEVRFYIDNIENVDSISTEICKSMGRKLTQAQKDGIKDYPKLSVELISKITKYITPRLLQKSTDSIPKAEDASFPQQKQTEETSEPSTETSIKNASFSWLNTIIYPAILPMIILLLIYLILNSKVTELKIRHRSLKSDIESRKMSSGTNNLQSQNNFQQNVTISKSEFEKYLGNSERFESFQNELEKLRIQLANLDKPKSIINQFQGESNSIQSNSANTSNDIFYMKYPVENSFSNNHKSNTKENTIYKFIIKSNKTEADFEIHTDGVKIEEIISMVEKAIKSGCEENNNPTNNTKNIRTLNAGLVTLEGDKWVIKRKAMIKYE